LPDIATQISGGFLFADDDYGMDREEIYSLAARKIKAEIIQEKHYAKNKTGIS